MAELSSDPLHQVFIALGIDNGCALLSYIIMYILIRGFSLIGGEAESDSG